MVARAVVDAVEARLAAMWAVTPVVGFLTPAARPTDGSGYVAVQYPVTNSDAISVGAPGQNLYRDEGVIRLLAHRPKAEAAQALDDADALAALFRGWQFGGVTCWAPDGAPLDDDNDRGLFFVVSVVVPYQFDHYG